MKIVTHNGKFHTDEVFASAMINFIYPEIEIVRTRDEEIIKEAKMDIDSIVIDVGRLYDVDKNAYDHHQTSFHKTYFGNPDGIPMSSCGLIWKHFSYDIIQKMLMSYFKIPLVNEFSELEIESDSELDSDEEGIINIPKIDYIKVSNKFYNEVVVSIDANDNGIKQIKNPKDVEYNFSNIVTLENIIGSYNSGKDDEEQLVCFRRAMKVCRDFLINRLKGIIKSEIIYSKYLSEFKENYMKNVEWIYLPNDKIPYTIYLSQFDPDKMIKFVVIKKTDQQYKIHTRRNDYKSYSIVAPIVNEHKARQLIGDDLIFVHKARFVGSTKTPGSAIDLVEASIREYWGWLWWFVCFIRFFN